MDRCLEEEGQVGRGKEGVKEGVRKEIGEFKWHLGE